MGPLKARLSWILVVIVATSGLAGLEAWPLTGWRMFSERRQPVAFRFEPRVVAVDGSEAPLPVADLPHAYSGWVPILEQMAAQVPDEREPACGAWAEATTRLTGGPVSEVRVYLVAEDLRDGSRRETLAWTCGRSGR